MLTENEILNSISKLNKDLTIIMIAHRMDVVKKFDKIIFLNNGRLEGFSSYSELVKKNKDFKELAEGKDYNE